MLLFEDAYSPLILSLEPMEGNNGLAVPLIEEVRRQERPALIASVIFYRSMVDYS